MRKYIDKHAMLALAALVSASFAGMIRDLLTEVGLKVVR